MNRRAVEAELSHLQQGLLPGESETAPPRKPVTLLAIAALNSEDFSLDTTAEAVARAGAAAASSATAVAASPRVPPSETAIPTLVPAGDESSGSESESDDDDSDNDEPLEFGEEEEEDPGGGAAAAPAAAAAAAAAAPARAKRKETGKAPLSAAQAAEIQKGVRQIENGTAPSFRFEAPEPSMSRRAFSAVAYTLLGFIV